MNKAELIKTFSDKIHDHVTIANMHWKQYYNTGNETSYRAAMDRVSRAYEDVEMMFTLKLITCEEAFNWQERISKEATIIWISQI